MREHRLDQLGQQVAIARILDRTLGRALHALGTRTIVVARQQARIDDDAQRQRRQIAFDVELAVGDAGQHEDAFKKCGASGQRIVDQERGIAVLALEQQVDGAADHRMVEPQQGQIFAGQRGRPIEGDHLRPILEARESVGAEVFGIEHDRARPMLLVLDTELLEQAQDEIVVGQVRVGIREGAAQAVGMSLAHAGEFEQAVAAGIDECRQFLMGGTALADQGIELGIRVFAAVGMLFGQFDQALAIALEQFATIGRTAAERGKPEVVPAHQGMLRGACEGAGVDHDVVLLADPVQPADALLEQVRIERQVPQDQMVGELEVAPLGADFRAQQQARAFLVGEVGGIAVALEQAHAFVEAGHFDSAAGAQDLFEGQHLGLAAADQ